MERTLWSWEWSQQDIAGSILGRTCRTSIANEADWPRMAKFHAEWSDKICNVVLPYLQNDDENDIRLSEIAGTLRFWTLENENLAKCNRTYTRFTTDRMSEILPNIENAPSGWNTDEHYFYEIINRKGNSIYIQLSISSQNATEEFLKTCDRINEFYPAKKRKDEWKWRSPFRTSAAEIPEDLKQDEIFANLDKCLEEIQAFELDLKQKLMVDC